MVNELWPSKKKAKSEVDDLLERIEGLAKEGEIAELRSLASDLRELAQSIQELITKLGSQKLYRTKAQGVEAAMAEIKKRIGIGSKRPPTGREAVRGMAAWIAEH